MNQSWKNSWRHYTADTWEELALKAKKRICHAKIAHTRCQALHRLRVAEENLDKSIDASFPGGSIKYLYAIRFLECLMILTLGSYLSMRKRAYLEEGIGVYDVLDIPIVPPVYVVGQ